MAEVGKIDTVGMDTVGMDTRDGEGRVVRTLPRRVPLRRAPLARGNPVVVSERLRRRRGERADYVAPVFAHLDLTGRMRLWLAGQLGVSKQKLWAVERGHCRVGPEWVRAACRALGVPPRRLGYTGPGLTRIA